ncbi:MAG: CBS domain-containing protein [Candidatus Aramenus sp.]|jgi:CBS domain-containing protein|nr:CBS domain-containing protein [Candidatus Aramenus sp.]
MGIIRESLILRPYDSLLYAIKVMIMESVPKAIVTDEKQIPLGYITQKDIIKFLFERTEKRHLSQAFVSEVMSKDFVCVNQNIDPLEAAEVMVDKRQPLLVVCNDDGKLVGMIIKSDLSSYYSGQIKGLQKVSEFMSSPAVTVSPDDDLSRAIKLMLDKNISRLIVVGERIEGTITTTDILYMAPVLKYKENRIDVADVMSPNLIVIDEEEDLANAAKLMASRKIKGIPVVKRDGSLSGVVTTTDIVRAMLDEKVRKYLYEVKMYTSTF